EVPPAPARSAASKAVHAPLPINATTLIRGMFQPPGSQPMPGLGTLPVEWLDLPMLANALRRVSSGAQLGPHALQYGHPAGDEHLRRVLATRLADHGLNAVPGPIRSEERRGG